MTSRASSRDGSWAQDESGAVLAFPIRELQGRIFGVVGWGDLGRGAARMAEAFGMRVMVANRPRRARSAGADGTRRAARHRRHPVPALSAQRLRPAV